VIRSSTEQIERNAVDIIKAAGRKRSSIYVCRKELRGGVIRLIQIRLVLPLHAALQLLCPIRRTYILYIGRRSTSDHPDTDTVCLQATICKSGSAHMAAVRAC
jgi:hypothetical protein